MGDGPVQSRRVSAISTVPAAVQYNYKHAVWTPSKPGLSPPQWIFLPGQHIIALDEFQCHEADMKFTEEMPGHVYTLLFSK
jgi:hypothetical protein